MIKTNVKGYVVPGLSIFLGLFSIYKLYYYFFKKIKEHMRELVFIRCELYQTKNNHKLLEIRLTNYINSINNKLIQDTYYIENTPKNNDTTNNEININEININEIKNNEIKNNEIKNNEIHIKDLEYDCITDIKHDIIPYKKHNSFNLQDIIKNIMF